MGRTLTVSHELAVLAPVTTAIERLGMAPVLQSASDPAPSAPREFGTGISRGQWIRMAVSGVLALGAEAMVFAGAPEASWPIILACLAAIGLGGVETLKKGWIALKTRSLNMNLLMTVAVIGAALIGQWPEAAVVIRLFGIAEMIEALSLDRARNAIRKLMDLAPENALVRQPTLHSENEPELLAQLNKETHQKILQPRMLSGHFQGRVLSMLSKIIHPNNILEIGTYTGYATLCLAEGLADNGTIDTIDVNEELVDFQRKYFDKSEWAT